MNVKYYVHDFTESFFLTVVKGQEHVWKSREFVLNKSISRRQPFQGIAIRFDSPLKEVLYLMDASSVIDCHPNARFLTILTIGVGWKVKFRLGRDYLNKKLIASEVKQKMPTISQVW